MTKLLVAFRNFAKAPKNGAMNAKNAIPIYFSQNNTMGVA
jgi:hypothetical protein